MKEIYVNKPKPVRRQIGKALSKAANNISRADVVGMEEKQNPNLNRKTGENKLSTSES
jgi:hypothetical protein